MQLINLLVELSASLQENMGSASHADSFTVTAGYLWFQKYHILSKLALKENITHPKFYLCEECTRNLFACRQPDPVGWFPQMRHTAEITAMGFY